MAQQLGFKTYERGIRAQQVDTSYTGGMLYSNVPLAEQYCKALVNMDITKEGTIKSREGLRQKSVTSTHNQITDEAYKLIDCVTASAYRGEVEDQHCVVASKADVETIANTKLVSKDLRVFMHTKENNTFYGNTLINCVKHTNATIHNVPTSQPIEQFVGCRAFNNDYYFLNKNGLCAQRYTDESYDAEKQCTTYTCNQIDVTPKECTVQEATNRGYNMLSPNPYAFQSVYKDTVLAPALQGIVPYSDSECTKLELTPKIGQVVYFNLIGEFRVPTDFPDYVTFGHETGDITIKWEVSTNSGYSFTTFKKDTVSASKRVSGWMGCAKSEFEEMLKAKYTVTNATATLIRVTLEYPEESTGSTEAVRVSLTTLDSFNFAPKKDTEVGNYDLRTYSLRNASGMCFFKERLILWGAPEDKSILFISDVRDPSYFPYPNNVNTFDEPIVQAVPLLDNLIVFTTTKVYLLTLDADYEHLTQNCIQNNLQIAPEDVHLTQIVKNMLYFKSGNYYYMIVPKANSLTGELTIAPVYKNIEYLLDNFKEELYKIIKMVYNYSDIRLNTLTLETYYNYLDYEDIVNVYAFKTKDNTYLNFCLLYNTIQRTWRIYVYETPSTITPVTKLATGKGIYAMLKGSDYCELIFDKADAQDDFGVTFKNYQLYDSGYRDQIMNLKKRYREFQFVLHNISHKKLNFGTGLFIDGTTRTSLYDAEFVVKALNDKGYEYTTAYTGTKQHVELVVENTFANVADVPSATVLGTWQLDSSVFPEQTVYKVRFPISGKGYAPRLLIVNKDEAMYELLNISYIYRQMYSR